MSAIATELFIVILCCHCSWEYQIILVENWTTWWTRTSEIGRSKRDDDVYVAKERFTVFVELQHFSLAIADAVRLNYCLLVSCSHAFWHDESFSTTPKTDSDSALHPAGHSKKCLISMICERPTCNLWNMRKSYKMHAPYVFTFKNKVCVQHRH